MRARFALAAATAAGLLLGVPTARAQDSGSAAWNGSSVILPSGPQSGPVHVEAYFTRNTPRSVRITVSVLGSAPAPGCSMPASVTSGAARTPVTFGADLAFGCNGSYTITALAETTDDGLGAPHDEASRAATVSVAMPAPTVTGVRAQGAGRVITVLWDDMRSAAADLSGYIVERKVGSGSFTEVATLGPNETQLVDSALPPEGGEATYRVASTRPSPGQRLTSQSTSSSATPFVADPTQSGNGDGTGDGTTPGGTGDGTTPGGTGDGTTPGGTGDGTGSTPGAPGAPGADTPPPGTTPGGRPGSVAVRPPRLGISGTFLPPLLRPSIGSITTATTIDGGYQETLPYGDEEPGSEDPVLPDDELASAFGDGAAGRGMAIPVATALVLAVWAFHLRFLARASRPTA